jgi:hydrogenase maturation protease
MKAVQIRTNVKSSRKSKPVLVIGVGSPHGDDRAGWEAIDRLKTQLPSDVSLRKAASPLDILDWLEVDVETHLVDASAAISSKTRWEKFEWPFAALSFIKTLCPASSHGIELDQALRLALELDRLPNRIAVWGIHASSSAAVGSLSEETAQAVEACVEALLKELDHA